MCVYIRLKTRDATFCFFYFVEHIEKKINAFDLIKPIQFPSNSQHYIKS